MTKVKFESGVRGMDVELLGSNTSGSYHFSLCRINLRGTSAIFLLCIKYSLVNGFVERSTLLRASS